MSTLYMVQLELDLPGMLRAFTRRKTWREGSDLGYLTHCELASLFGASAPKPFCVREAEERLVRVLGYSSRSADELRSLADATAEPDVHAACSWDSLASKRMPDLWTSGQQWGFEVRVVPVTRKSSSGEHHKRGAEVDAFLSRCWHEGPETVVSREEVYSEWLRNCVGPAAVLREVRVTRFQRNVLLRRTQAQAQAQTRSTQKLERPDVTLEGVIEVQDPERFANLLARGIGRHRTFGFGMLLIRQAKEC